MKRFSQRTLVCLMAFLACALPATAADKMHVYFIGNSLTMSTTLDRVHQLMELHGIDMQYGSQLSGGKSLFRHLNYEDEPNQKWKSWETNKPEGNTFEPDTNMYQVTFPERFGRYDTALKDHKWDKVVFQLYGGTLKEDLTAISAFIDLAVANGNADTFYLYSTWPRRDRDRQPDGSIKILNIDYQQVWDAEYTASAEDTGKQARWNYATRSYVDTLYAALKAKYPRVNLYVIPVGEVLYALDEKIRNDELPGLRALAKRKPELVPGIDEDTSFADGVNVLYADAIHFNPIPHQMDALGIYVSGSSVATALAYRNPVGISAEAYGLDDRVDAELIRAIQETIREVFGADKRVGPR